METLNGLERKLTISIPSERVEQEVTKRLRNLARNAKIDGFRPGKVPMNVVEKRFSNSVRAEVAEELIPSFLFDALKENNLSAAGQPTITPEHYAANEDLRFTAVVEVFPEISVAELTGENAIEQLTASVSDADVEKMLLKLQEQNKVWDVSSQDNVQQGDKLDIDFKGFIGDEPFEGGEAKNFNLEVGSKSMIPGFEEAMIGHKQGESFSIDVSFPADYNHASLAGKDAKFDITINKIESSQLPELNDAFAEKFNITEGGLDALKKDLRQNMDRELERKLSSMNRERIFDSLLKVNTFDLPSSLIEQEIEHLKHDMFHRIYGDHHSDNEKIPDFPKELFIDQAKRRVQLGLLFSEYVELHQIKVDKDRVSAMIDKMANAYEHPQELRDYYYGKNEHLAEIEALVMEEMVAEKVSASAKLSTKNVSYDEIMNPQKNNTTMEIEETGDAA